ncbi:MAG: META domain-containing protein [Leucobacter sp.]
MKRIFWTIGAAAALALSLSACSAAGSSVVGTWGDPGAAEEPSLEFTGTETEGEYSGTDGCNNIGGSYTVDGDEVDLGVMRATMMFCEGVDTWLSQAARATISGSTMTFLDQSGATVGTLERGAE